MGSFYGFWDLGIHTDVWTVSFGWIVDVRVGTPNKIE